MVIIDYYLWFVLYSVIGWVYESIVCSVSQRRFVNRGFLNGPYCPIYGTGAVICIMLLGRVEEVAPLFLSAMVVTGVIEYFTSWAMEKLFHARWWDYSKRRFNLNGRVFLGGLLVFALLIVLLIKFIHPFILQGYSLITPFWRVVLACVAFVLFLVDSLYTIKSIKDIDKKLKQIEENLNKKLAAASEQWNELKAQPKGLRTGRVHELTEDLKKRLNTQERRMLRVFPKWQSVNHDETSQRIKDYFAQSSLKKRIEKRKKR